MRWTEAVDVPVAFATILMLIPSFRAFSTLSTRSGDRLGRPNWTPFARARAKPARTLPLMSSRSNSLNTASIWKSMRPLGVLVSTDC